MLASHRTQRRLTLPFSLALTLLLTLSAGFGALRATAQEITEITYFTFSAAPDHVDTLDAMVDAFEAANPGIEVNVETAPYDSYFTELQTRVAGGEAPDVFELNYENFVTYAAKDVLLDLTDLAAADPELAARFYPEAYAAFAQDGQQFGLPASFSDVVLFYNKDLFDAAGVAYPTADWKWADEVAAAKQLTDADSGVWGSYAPIQFFEFYKTAAQNGCGVFGPDGSVTINEPACVEALEYMVAAPTVEKIQPTDEDLAGVSDGDFFKSGNLAMLTTGIWMFSAFADAPFNWDIAVEPGNVQDANHFFANAAVVAADTENPDAAWTWASFFTSSPEAGQLRVDASWELPALADQALFDSYLSVTPPESRQVVFDALDAIVTPPVIENQAQMQDAINALIDQVKLGDLTPREALDQAKTEIEALV